MKDLIDEQRTEVENEELTFSLIYSFDVECEWNDAGTKPTRNNKQIKEFMPPARLMKHFEQTEGDDGYEYGGEFGPGKHRKYCAILNQEEFEEFLNHTGLRAERVNTMGAIGMPGHGYGLVPAISFENYDSRALTQNAYVLPNLTEQQAEWFERDFEKCKEWIWDYYGEEWG